MHIEENLNEWTRVCELTCRDWPHIAICQAFDQASLPSEVQQTWDAAYGRAMKHHEV